MKCITKQYLNLGLDILDCVAWLHFKSDGLASQCLDKDLHATSQTKDQVQRRLFLDVVVTEGATIFQLLASKDQTLLVGVECPPCPESWPSHSRWCRLAPLQE